MVLTEEQTENNSSNFSMIIFWVENLTNQQLKWWLKKMAFSYKITWEKKMKHKKKQKQKPHSLFILHINKTKCCLMFFSFLKQTKKNIKNLKKCENTEMNEK